MTDFRAVLMRLHDNLNLLQERRAKYGDNPPLELSNQIKDHQEAIELSSQLIAGDISEAEWREAIEPLLVAINQRSGEAAVNLTININQAPEPSPGPPNTRIWRLVVAVGIVVALVAGTFEIAGVTLQDIWAALAPSAISPAASDETLILITTFHETTAIKSEPHVKIQRAIKEEAEKLQLGTLRVELEPAILKADQRKEAEALGNRYNASIIIWGEDTGAQMLVNFLNLKQSDFVGAEVKIEENERVQLVKPDAYARFVVKDLPGQISFLSLFAVGQSYLVAEQYEQARDIIQRGIDSLSDESQPPGLSQAYFRLGWLAQELKEPPQLAIFYCSKSLELDPEFTRATSTGVMLMPARRTSWRPLLITPAPLNWTPIMPGPTMAEAMLTITRRTIRRLSPITPVLMSLTRVLPGTTIAEAMHISPWRTTRRPSPITLKLLS